VGSSTALAPTIVGCAEDSAAARSGGLPTKVVVANLNRGGGGTGSIGGRGDGGSTGSTVWLLNMVGWDEESAGAGDGMSGGGDVFRLALPGTTTVASDR